MKIKAFNPPTDELEKTYLSAYIDKEATSLPVKNNQNFADTLPILLGRMGDERTEIVYVDGVPNVNGIEIVSTETKFPHNADDPVYALEYDKVSFWRCGTIDGTYTLMTTVDIDVDNADDTTVWDDETSLSSHWYKISYENSISGAESELSDPIQASGYSTKTAGSIIDKVVRRVRDQSYNVLTPDEYIDIMNEVGDDLITQAHRPYRFLKKKALLNTTLNVAYVDLPDDLWKFNHVFVSTSSGNYQRFDEVEVLSAEQFYNRYDNNQHTPQDNIIDVAIDEETNRLLIYPTPKTSQTGVIKLSYYKAFDEITSLGDLVETPNTLIYRYKLMAEYYSAKSETDNQWARLAERYESKYGNEIVKMQRVNRLDTGTPRSMMPRRSFRRRRYDLR